ncbi:MAG: hypothetical protein HYV07_19675 [Deltaproteobacteria bacterium]|nr:hypothetical protein [Deltaproteobacteria bacterium]
MTRPDAKRLVGGHEDLSREPEVRPGPNRSFGFVFAAFFVIVGASPLGTGGKPRLFPLAIAACFLVAAIAKPDVLAPLNRLWTRLGVLLQKIVSPVALGALFFGVMVPMGVVMRALGYDPLRLSWDKNAKTYWIERNPPGPPPPSMTRPF